MIAKNILKLKLLIKIPYRQIYINRIRKMEMNIKIKIAFIYRKTLKKYLKKV